MTPGDKKLPIMKRKIHFFYFFLASFQTFITIYLRFKTAIFGLKRLKSVVLTISESGNQGLKVKIFVLY